MNPLHDDPKVSTRGRGNYGVRFTRFVESGAPGGYSTLEFVTWFPTRKERDLYARKLRQKWKGNRRTGPIIEILEVEVAELRWFEPVYLRAALVADDAERRYGMVRIYDTNPPVHDVRYARDEEELRRMLAEQWESGGFGGTPAPGEPHAPYDVYFFAADEPPRLRVVIEQDDLDDDEACE